MVRFRVLPYRQGSKSAKALADALGGKVLKLVGSQFKPKPGDVIINWGNTKPTSQVFPNWYSQAEGQEAHWQNGIVFVQNVSNKLSFFNRMKEVNPEIIPRFWTKKEDIPDEAFPIVCRTTLAGHSGDGIVIADTVAGLVDAPLYVEYKKKKDEYRVHVGRVAQPEHNYLADDTTSIIAVQRKARRTNCENPNWKVRNLAGGFVYVRNEVTPPAGVVDAATAAFQASGLDFGAVDVIWNSQENKAYVLEINTAPGLEGQTIEDYAKFFKGVVD